MSKLLSRVRSEENPDAPSKYSLGAYPSSILDQPKSRDWGNIAPELWLGCWSEIDENARMVVTSERILLCCDVRCQAELSTKENLRQRRSLVEPSDPAELRKFEAFLNVAAGSVNTFCLPRRRKGGHLLMRASLLKEISRMPLIGIVFHPTGQDFTPRWADIKAIFNLTSAEHGIVHQLLQGVRPDAIAVSRDLSINTVRTHISHAYDKIGISSRDDLWRRLAPYRIN